MTYWYERDPVVRIQTDSCKTPSALWLESLDMSIFEEDEE